MSWDLNDDQYNSGGGSNKIFNNGKVGVAENVRVEVAKKGADDHEKAPDYSINFYDSEDRKVNIGFWLGNDTSDWSEGKKKIEGARMKHLLHTFLGDEYKSPKYDSYDAMIEGVMKELKGAVANVPVRVLTTYGSPDYPKNFPTVRFAPPFVESMSVPTEDSRLRPSERDLMTRPSADEESPALATAEADTDDDW